MNKTIPKQWLLDVDNAINNARKAAFNGNMEQIEEHLYLARHYLDEYWKSIDSK